MMMADRILKDMGWEKAKEKYKVKFGCRTRQHA